MYYAEKIIEGVLCYRTSPNGKWYEFSKRLLTDKIERLEKELQILQL